MGMRSIGDHVGYVKYNNAFFLPCPHGAVAGTHAASAERLALLTPVGPIDAIRLRTTL
ncbi:hypothetical protein THIARS_60712 [Thiomonas delicata]|uniref:Uncharacterized protein n=1 Tax=Thiomonas delicata TaxID=364030 RepID=A0A238D468_THIDL|nr:hypothetical protein THIARS_60712 [Thiomonas delicata]